LSSQTTHPRCRQPCHCTPRGQRRQTASSSPNDLGPLASHEIVRLPSPSPKLPRAVQI
jgi:hypothetical protein